MRGDDGWVLKLGSLFDQVHDRSLRHASLLFSAEAMVIQFAGEHYLHYLDKKSTCSA
jgi:hypothetical protein